MRVLAAIAVALLAARCTGGNQPSAPPRASTGASDRIPGTASPSLAGGFVLASSFEQPVCGVWWRPDPGCEFGVEGDVVSGEFSCRTGRMCLRFQRMNREMHVAVISPAPAVGGRAFIGAAHRIGEIPDGAFERLGYLELMQLNPTDGSESLPAWPVEVRIYEDRRLGLGLSQVDVTPESTVVMTDWKAPVDEWFYIVVEIANGDPATQRMWVYGPDDQLAERVSVSLTTRIEWVHDNRAAQKVGGSVSSELPMFTYADDWYVASTFQGPLHIDANGAPLAG